MATLTKWSPFRELDWMDRPTSRFFQGFPFASVVFPSADFYETKDEFILELEVPGFDEKQLGIEMSDHTLTVKGERMDTKEEKEKEKFFRLHERFGGEFERRFTLPSEADMEHVKASFSNGVLHVYAPKLAISKPYKVAISKN
jgi:HSP20 family protein